MSKIRIYKLVAEFFAVILFGGCSEDPSEVFDITVSEGGTQAVLIGEKPGHLKEQLGRMKREGEWDPYALKKLIVKGNLNGNDVTAIRELTNTQGKVEELDFSEANLLERAFPDFAFASSLHIRKVIFPENLKYSGRSLISRSGKLIEIQLNEGLEVLEGNALAGGADTKVKDINIPQSVRIIGRGAFSMLPEVTHFDLPEKLDSIGIAAFDRCQSLTALHIPSGIRHIADAAFRGCIKLKKIDLPEKITSIGTEAFIYCEALTDIKLPDSLRVIGQRAFSRSGLTSLKLPPHLQRIENEGLSEIYSIERLIIPDKVTFIGDYAFSGNTDYSHPEGMKFVQLKAVYLPKRVEHIGRYAFTNLPLLEELHVKWDNPLAVPGAFDSFKKRDTEWYKGIDKSKVTLYVPKATKAAYQKAEDWKEFTNIVEE